MADEHHHTHDRPGGDVKDPEPVETAKVLSAYRKGLLDGGFTIAMAETMCRDAAAELLNQRRFVIQVPVVSHD